MHLVFHALGLLALAQFRDSFFDRYPWFPDFLALFGAFGLIGLMYYFFRGSRGPSGFTIHVDDDDITFNGDFPAQMQGTVIDFLRDDCRIEGPYQIRGHWEGSLLIIVVQGENARPQEQRIRNFLKLNLKAPNLHKPL